MPPPIAVRSASARTEDQQAGFAARAEFSVTKTVDFAVLAEILASSRTRAGVGSAENPTSVGAVFA